MPSGTKRLHVLLSPEEAERLDAYCREHGFKKSTLVARLIREFLDSEGFPRQGNLFPKGSE
jgi:hypothetical protein